MNKNLPLLFLLLFGTTLTKAQSQFQWAKNITPTTANNYAIVASAVSTDGFIYVAGTGGSPAENFIVKYNAAGNFIWKKPVTPNILTFANMIVDRNNEIIIMGWQYYQGIRLAKLDTAGNEIWFSSLTGFFGESVSVAVDNSNNIYFTARKNTGGQADSAMIKKYSPQGNFLQNSPPFFYCHRMSIAFNSADEMFVTGEVDPGIYPNNVFGKIGNTPIFLAEPSWFYGNFIAKFSPAMATQWIRTSSTSSGVYDNSIAVDGNYVYTCWPEKVRGAFSFYPRLNKYDMNGNFIDSIRYPIREESSLVPVFKLAKADTAVFVLQFASQPYNEPDTVFVHQYHESLQKRTTLMVQANYIAASGIMMSGKNAYVTGRFNDPSGMAKFDVLTVNSNLPGNSSHYDMFLSKVDFSTAALPVRLVSFTGSLKERKVQLQWITVAEINMQQYSILKSMDGTKFEKIGTVAAVGNNSYQFMDDIANDKVPTVFYKLEMKEKNGTSTNSNAIAIHLGKQPSFFSIYPNPVKDNLNIQFATSLPSQNLHLTIADVQGRQVFQKDMVTQQPIMLNVKNFPKGHYLLTIIAGEWRHTEKILIE